MIKPSLAKGTRDFGPLEMKKRKFIFSTIENIFKLHGFECIETPAMENIATLTGKYGEEGDKLLFKILDSGDYWGNAEKNLLPNDTIDSQKLTPLIASKGLKYDLTVPFARFVSMNRNSITFPFKRYQMQPVWRADRPQKGRYREFWQCDADCIGSKDMSNEAELIVIFDSVFRGFGIQSHQIHLNNRKILEGISQLLFPHVPFITFTTILDKYDKIGWEGISKEFGENGIDELELKGLSKFLVQEPLTQDLLNNWKAHLQNSPMALLGLQEIEEVFHLIKTTESCAQVVFDGTLARGLSYYTGCIFEVKIKESGLGSVAAGGRYDNLTEIFGLKDVSGVGISFGADRIFDYLENQNLYPKNIVESNKILICALDLESMPFAFALGMELRNNKIETVLYPGNAKLKKQLDFANTNQYKFVVLIGENERKENMYTLKNMVSGTQNKVNLQELIHSIQLP